VAANNIFHFSKIFACGEENISPLLRQSFIQDESNIATWNFLWLFVSNHRRFAKSPAARLAINNAPEQLLKHNYREIMALLSELPNYYFLRLNNLCLTGNYFAFQQQNICQRSQHQQANHVRECNARGFDGNLETIHCDIVIFNLAINQY